MMSIRDEIVQRKCESWEIKEYKVTANNTIRLSR